MDNFLNDLYKLDDFELFGENSEPSSLNNSLQLFPDDTNENTSLSSEKHRELFATFTEETLTSESMLNEIIFDKNVDNLENLEKLQKLEKVDIKNYLPAAPAKFDLKNLTTDIMKYMICHNLDPKEIVKLRAVSKTFNKLVDEINIENPLQNSILENLNNLNHLGTHVIVPKFCNLGAILREYNSELDKLGIDQDFQMAVLNDHYLNSPQSFTPTRNFKELKQRQEYIHDVKKDTLFETLNPQEDYTHNSDLFLNSPDLNEWVDNFTPPSTPTNN